MHERTLWLLQVNGFAAQYEQTGDKDALTAVQHFFDVVTHHHSYATGGIHHWLSDACTHRPLRMPPACIPQKFFQSAASACVRRPRQQPNQQNSAFPLHCWLQAATVLVCPSAAARGMQPLLLRAC